MLAPDPHALPGLRPFLDARAGFAAGTDTPQQFVIPGVSLHRELELYVAGGMSPAAAIRTATADAAHRKRVPLRAWRL